MPQANVNMHVRRIDATTSIIDIQGEVSAFAEKVLMDAYQEASTPTTRNIILNFAGLEYMNSSGIGLLVTLLIRIKRQKQHLLAYGLSEHYRHIFEITRLNEAIAIYDSESKVLAVIQHAGGLS
ncbi:MAG TPA: anti-sigma factor antagonist, partial [Ktedonobacter sp.]|jgi:anti-sigma B factor antagonist|nr:anti-sigma factor antagonist [Ktedonobacter sp.]HAH00645.1 anti-sigma factor antagonist [Ktedonobacter sp.]HAT44413.1 anti-sigma factor antagonist [Ktedonobacter sp.]HBE27118.1 anti-sigma factor antagonist [Ktedonobacter sp.]